MRFPCHVSFSLPPFSLFFFFFFNDTATTEIYTLSLHDALPIYEGGNSGGHALDGVTVAAFLYERSEEHTSELQSRSDLVCRLLLEKKKNFASPCFSLKNLYHTTQTFRCPLG